MESVLGEAKSFDSKSHSVSLVRDSTFLVSAEFFAIIFGLLSQIILTRGLENDEFGLWIILFDIGLTIFMLSDPGFSTLISRELPLAKNKSLTALRSILTIQISFVMLAFATTVGAIFFFEEDLRLFDNLTVMMIIFGTLSISLSPPFKTFLRTTGKASWEALFRILERMSLTIGFLIVFENEGKPEDFALVIALVPFITTSMLILFSFIHATRISSDSRKEEEITKKSDVNFSPKEILRRSLPFFIFIFALQVIDRADKFILAFYVPLDYIATYGIALIVFFSGMTIVRIIRNVIMPWFSEFGDNEEKLGKRFLQASLFTFSIVPIGVTIALLVMLTVPIVIFPEDLIYPEHDSFTSESIFRILLITWSINMTISPSWEIIRAFQPASTINLISVAGLLCTVVTGIILIPVYGVYGGATMTIFAPLTFLILTHHRMERRLRDTLPIGYFYDLILMLLFAFSPLILFVPELSPISGFILIICLSVVVEIKLLRSLSNHLFKVKNSK
tara:strand:+ start:4001 stop:5518 length:1518 start_codon:yes stop_codon:yes gene_type:complete